MLSANLVNISPGGSRCWTEYQGLKGVSLQGRMYPPPEEKSPRDHPLSESEGSIP